jgi:hypothetical protein
MALGTGTRGKTGPGSQPGRWSTDDRDDFPAAAEEDIGVSALFEAEEAEEILDTSGASDLSDASASDSSV